MFSLHIRETRVSTGAYTLLWAIFLVALAACDSTGPAAVAQEPTERVVLQARHPLGVPLHPAERSRSLSGRMADGVEVEVVRWASDRRWLEVRGADGARGWITARYLASAAEAERRRPPDAWSSREACLALLEHVPRRETNRARLASWNLRWFPDGSTGGRSETPTDIEWVACLIATMRVDAVAVQEIVLHARGRVAVDRLLARLNALAGGRWRAIFDECPRDGRQHVGWLIDGARADVLASRQIDELNPAGGGCAHRLRPGAAVRLRFAGGLDLWAISVHFDSGVEARDHGHRRVSYGALVRAAAALGTDDGDVIALGDLNTMGCSRCARPIEASAEIAALDAVLAPSLVRLPSAVACTEYYRGRGVLLDHVVASTSMRELPANPRVDVHGPCAHHRCRLPGGVRPPMLEHLSDHCPIVVELEDVDED